RLDREHDDGRVARRHVVARDETGDATPPSRAQLADRLLRLVDGAGPEEDLVPDAGAPRRKAATGGTRRAEDADAHATPLCSGRRPRQARAWRCDAVTDLSPNA